MKKMICLFLCVILFVSSVGLASAENVYAQSSKEGFNVINWFKNVFNIQEFTIVGQDRQCDVNPRQTIDFARWDLMDVKSSTYCGNSNGLIDLFDQNWNEVGEFKGSMLLYCGDIDGCRAEVYCCPHPECSGDSNCVSWVGTGSQCKTKTATDPYLPLMDNVMDPILSYKYCSSSCSGSSISCWRIESGVCNSRTYDCSYATYPSCPTTYPYTSASSCQANVPVCKSEGQSCTTASNCCFGLDCQYFQCVNTGTCTSGATKCGIVGNPNTAGEVLYNCVSGTWQSQGRVDGQCGYSSVECTSGQTKCEGTTYFTCLASSNSWITQGQVNGQCGYTSEAECYMGQTKCEGYVYYTCPGGNNIWVSQGESENCGYSPQCSVTREQLGTFITQWTSNQITRDVLGSKMQIWSQC